MQRKIEGGVNVRYPNGVNIDNSKNQLKTNQQYNRSLSGKKNRTKLTG